MAARSRICVSSLASSFIPRKEVLAVLVFAYFMTILLHILYFLVFDTKLLIFIWLQKLFWAFATFYFKFSLWFICSFRCVLFVVFAVKRLVFLWQNVWCFCGKINVCCRFAQAWSQMEQMENSMVCWDNVYTILKTLNVITLACKNVSLPCQG